MTGFLRSQGVSVSEVRIGAQALHFLKGDNVI